MTEDSARAHLRIVPPAPCDAVAHRRELGRKRSKQLRHLQKLYGKGGYRIGQRVTPTDVLQELAKKYPALGEAVDSGDEFEIDRLLDWLEAAAAEGNLASFEEEHAASEGGWVV